MLILKFHPGMKCLHVFLSFFHPGMKFYPCLSNYTIYKKFNYLFKNNNKKSKISYYQCKLKLFETHVKKTRKIIKEVIGKKRGTSDSLPRKLIIDKVEIVGMKTTANSISNFFVKIGLNLASKIPKSDTNFEVCISKVNIKLQENYLTEDKFLEALKSLKIN